MHGSSVTSSQRPSYSLARAIVAGFIALGVSTVSLVAVSGIAGILGEAYRDRGMVFEWMYQLTHNAVVDLGRSSLFASLAIHLLFGMLWSLLYALVFEPRLRSMPGWKAGAIFSLGPFFLSVVVFLPLTGGGLFGEKLGAGPLPVLGNLLLHLLFGAVLGAGYSADAEEQPERAVPHGLTMARAETHAAVGIFAGVVLGGIAGSLLSYVFPPAELGKVIGSWPIAMGVAGALAGGAVGALIGSLSGLTEPEATPMGLVGSKGQPLSAAFVPLAALLMVATLIISIGSMLLTVGDTQVFGKREGYNQAIVLGLSLLALVTGVSTALDRWWAGKGRSGH